MISSRDKSLQILNSWKAEQTAVHVEVVCAGGEFELRGLGHIADLDEDKLALGAGASGLGLRPGLWDFTLRFPPEGASASFIGLRPISSDLVVEVKSGSVDCVLHGRKPRF